jgi:hypothetical protein
MLVALLALFAAFGGTSYAAAKISSKQIENNSVRGIDVKNRSLTRADLKANALGGAQVNESKLGKVPSAATADRAGSAQSADSVPSAQKAVNADTVKTAQAAVTVQSSTTATRAAKAGETDKLGGQPLGAFARGITYEVDSTALNSDDEKTISVPCPPGTNVIAGGADVSGALNENIAMTDTTAIGDSGWTASAVEANPTGDNWRLRVEATCAVI